MKRLFVWIIAVALAALLQTTWLDAIAISGVVPDLTLLLVVYYAAAQGEEKGMWTGVLGGLIRDVDSDSILGHHVLCLVVAAFIMGRISTRLIVENPAVKVSLVFIASLLHDVLFITILNVKNPATESISMLSSKAIPGAFYTALATPVVFLLLDRSVRRFMSAQSGAA